MTAPEEPAAPSSRTAILVSLAVGLGISLLVVVGTMALRPDAAPGTLPPNAGGIGPVTGPDSSPLPEVSLEGLDGASTIELAAYEGRPLVVNFWATWCPPCVEEMPDFQRFSVAVAGEVAVLGVNVQDRLDAARGFVEDLEITYDLAVDPRAEFYTAVGGYGMPTTLLVDASGVIRYRHTGPLDEARLRALVAEHLGLPLAAAD